MKELEFKVMLNEALILYMEDGLAEIKGVKTLRNNGYNNTGEEIFIKTKDNSVFKLSIISIA